MDFNSTIDLIIRELEEAREIIDDLKKFPGAPVLQIELAKSKCRNAAEVISLLKDSANAAVETDAIITPVPKAIQIEQEVTPIATPVKSEPERPVVPPQTEAPVYNSFSGQGTLEIEVETAHEMPPEAQSEAPEKEKPASKKPFVAPIIADTFSHLANRFNEQLGDSQSDDFSYTHGKHLANLSEAIGINDKFYYIREIFDGNRDSYSQALLRLEKAQNLAEARVVLMSFRPDKSENPAVRQLLDLVRRKFTGNE